jgi:hypothetical protein
VPVDLAAWCRHESVNGGGKDALNEVRTMPKTASKAAVFCRLPTDMQLLVDNILITSLLLRGSYTNDGCCAFFQKRVAVPT